MRSLVLAAIAVLVPAFATPAQAHWGSTHGSGTKVTVKRDVAEFKSIRLQGCLDVNVEVGPERSMSITLDDNLVPLVETKVSGGVLVIELEDVSYNGKGIITLTTPMLEGVDLHGSGDVTVKNAKGDQKLNIRGSGDITWEGDAGSIDVAVHGSGDVLLRGKAGNLTVSINGSGDVTASSLVARNVSVEIHGSGDADVHVDGGKLEAEVRGSGDIEWTGTASSERTSVHGSGDIDHD